MARLRQKRGGTSTANKEASVQIRRARKGDAESIAELSGQLGYPAKPREIVERLQKIKSASQHAVLVAESPQGDVIGWIHVSVEPLLEAGVRAEVNGLVVADSERSRGAGTLLLAEAEKWARKHGCRNVSVRSNVVRERAHQFYERHGYEHYKTQKAFRKSI